jgi:hypothetical protein
VLAAGRDLADPVSMVMTSSARTVPLDATVDDAVLVMLTYGVRHLSVLGLLYTSPRAPMLFSDAKLGLSALLSGLHSYVH